MNATLELVGGFLATVLILVGVPMLAPSRARNAVRILLAALVGTVGVVGLLVSAGWTP